MVNYETKYIINAPASIKKCITVFQATVFHNLLNLTKEDPLSGKIWVAGGAVRDFFNNTPRKDLDLYFSDETTYLAIHNILRNKYKNFKTKINNPNVLKIQFLWNNKIETLDLVKKFYPTPSDTLRSFDFTVCCAAVTPLSFIYHSEFFVDNLAKTLQYNRQPNSLGDLYRLQKYVQKGYRAPNSTLLALGKAINGMNLEDPIYNCLQFDLNGKKRDATDDLSILGYGNYEKEEDLPF